jgi:hypothetical protein
MANPTPTVTTAVVPTAGTVSAATDAPQEVVALSMGAIIRNAVTTGNPVEAKRTALEWMRLCTSDTAKALYAAVDGCLEMAAIPGCVGIEDTQRDPQPFLEQLPEWVRDRNMDLTYYSLTTLGGRPGKRATQAWERFWAIGVGNQSVGDLLDAKVPELLEKWFVPMAHHGIRTLRHVATVATMAIAQALGHHCKEMTKQRDLNRKQLEVAGNKQNQAVLLTHEISLLETRIQQISSFRQRMLESAIPHRNRDVCEIIRLYSLVEIDKLMRQEPAIYLQQKWTARVFLMIHDQSAEVRLKAMATITAWFERIKFYDEATKDHLFQFAERCMSHIVDRSRDIDSRVACKAIHMLRLPVLAERMTDEEVERIVNLVSMAKEPEVRQESALFVNAQVFQDPGIVTPELPRKRKRTTATARGKQDGDDEGMELGDYDDEQAADREVADGFTTLLNSETSISMFVEYLENYLGQNLRITDRATNAFWGRAPCLSYWSTMVSLMILGEANSGPGLDPVSSRQRLILLYVMEAAVRRAMEDVRRIQQSTRDRDRAVAKMDSACTSIIPELPRLFELCHSETSQMLILSHICKLLVDHAESRKMTEVFANARPLIRALQQCVMSRCYSEVTKNCTDSLLKVAGFTAEAKSAFLETARSIHFDTVKLVEAMCNGELEGADKAEELRVNLRKFQILNLRAIDMCFGRFECLDSFYKLLDVRVENMQLWREQSSGDADDATDFQFAVGMPDGSHTIYLVHSIAIVMVWHFRFCHWENIAPGSRDVKDLDAVMQGTQIKEMFKLCPKLFRRLRDTLCALMEADGSPHVRFLAFSSYMMIMQVALGVSEHLDCERSVEGIETDEVRKGGEPVAHPEHVKLAWQFLNKQLVEVQPLHTTEFDEEGQRVEPQDLWPPLSLSGQTTSVQVMFQWLTEENVESLRTNSFEAEDAEKVQERQLLRTVLSCKMVLESEVEDLYTGPLAALVLTQLDRAKPKPLREVAKKLITRLRDEAKICEDYAKRYFLIQKATVQTLYDQVGLEAAVSLAHELAKMWGLRIMPWLEKPFYDTLVDAVSDCASRGAEGVPLLEVFSVWIRGDDFVTETRRRSLADQAKDRFQELGVDESVQGLAKFISRCTQTGAFHPPMHVEAATVEPPATEATDPEPVPTPTGKRLREKTRAEAPSSGRSAAVSGFAGILATAKESAQRFKVLD